MQKSKNIEDYFSELAPHAESMKLLRLIVNSFPFDETVKWAFPVYMIGGKNIIGLGGFKAYAGIWFFQGSFLADADKRLVNAQEGKTQGMRQWRFNNVEEIRGNEALIRAYLQEAIDNHYAGKEVRPMKQSAKPLILPPELQEVLSSNHALKDSFESHSLTNKRDFAAYIATAKRVETKEKRLAKIIPMIQSGEGLGDKYKK